MAFRGLNIENCDRHDIGDKKCSIAGWFGTRFQLLAKDVVVQIKCMTWGIRSIVSLKWRYEEFPFRCSTWIQVMGNVCAVPLAQGFPPDHLKWDQKGHWARELCGKNYSGYHMSKVLEYLFLEGLDPSFVRIDRHSSALVVAGDFKSSSW